jgi:hypothetical protein
MRYLIDPEFRTAKLQKPVRSFIPYAAELRRELSLRNLRWALDQGHAHEVSLGTVPAVIYRENEAGNHGNFLAPAYRSIKQTPAWARRLAKVNTSARRARLSRDPDRRELDSSSSSAQAHRALPGHRSCLRHRRTRDPRRHRSVLSAHPGCPRRPRFTRAPLLRPLRCPPPRPHHRLAPYPHYGEAIRSPVPTAAPHLAGTRRSSPRRDPVVPRCEIRHKVCQLNIPGDVLRALFVSEHVSSRG